MKMFQSLILILIYFVFNIHSKCIWYEGIRDNYNEVYLNGEPKPLPLDDINLLNEMCPHIPTQKGLNFLYYLNIIFFLNRYFT